MRNLVQKMRNSTNDYRMDLSKQVDLLNSINILAIKLRFLRNLIKFLNSNLSNLQKTLRMAYILSFLLELFLLDSRN